MNRVGQTVI